jgi:hypothetical protein
MTRRQEFVVFYSPGTLFAESSAKPIERRDVAMAARMAADVTERYNAKPYGFQFETRIIADPIPDGEGGTMRVLAKAVDVSGTHFLCGTLETYDDVVKRDNPEESILRSNMRGMSPIVCVTENSFLSTMPFEEGDCVLDVNGVVVERGDDPKWVAYRADVRARP